MWFRNSEQQRRFLIKHYMPVPEAGCWLWMGAQSGKGYGQIFKSRHHKFQLAHRYFYEELVGPIPAGAILCHKCDTPLCVNPQHMRVGTQQDNVRDMRDKRRGAYGNTNYPKKLTEEAVAEILVSHERYSDLAEKYGVSKGLITAVRCGRVWRDVHPELQRNRKEWKEMSRRFGYPAIVGLEEGANVCVLLNGEAASKARHKIARYGARHGKRYEVAEVDGGVRVRRLPVTDTELPGVG